ncbi:MAG: histidine--tRNA ligase [Verrucomicrobiota bacterium]|jgi:histidyl-tRNA synthetase|nr:histidine--tRNA ligase [Verrucomicrobiota bacterium]MDP6250699.1 histidine--tRNA ligase [Verrucomicrobiota bacterium]MDP7176828.1 histidine--tRNA ligase [Verrucomicrobiota bacterium]MDP7290676.1 histidine--tRNA ligase [Verrucomicrobiota bacterium]MDP7440382.1 histidine--tRNA ligase [Verrucomicrobiota bacterium]|tara:strand:- start:633 stop:1874 length:1242 start_codon:yes stop_codon:yes gene_type:complete
MKGLPGFRDFYPEPIPTADSWSLDLRRHIFDTWRGTAERYGFREYDGPPIEELELYTKKSGDEIVGQLYNFTDKGSRNVSLRPEMTPTLARMAAAHTRNYKKPIKWFSIPQLFRYERQQKGRLREHFQLNADIIGEENLAADAELIALLIDTLRNLKLTSDDFVVRLSSRHAWQDFFENSSAHEKDVCDFYQIIDKLDREDPIVSGEKLAKLGFSLEQVNDFIESGQATDELAAIIGNIEARGLGDFIKVDYQIIRGLAYYTGPVYEAFDKRGKFRAIAGGGRYDHLVKLVSGGKTDLPALGFGMGDVVLAELLKDRGLVPPLGQALDAFVQITDESLRNASLSLVQQLRQAGQATEYPLLRAKPDKQLKRALELKAKWLVTLDNANQAHIKNLGTREEQTVPLVDVASALQD